jgi:hypothetical protein
MRYSSFIFSPLFFSFITLQLAAQPITEYVDISILLKADSTSKSVVVSNIRENWAGDMSPFIGAGSWFENGKQVQCRSLLAFDYENIPKEYTPEMITKAYLILNPLKLNTPNEWEEKQFSKFSIYRVLQPWQDNLTSWENQPLAGKNEDPGIMIPLRPKDRNIKIDVTKLVKKMFLEGNNGFLISIGDSLENSNSASQWFASTRNMDENLRPFLIINYYVPHTYVRLYEKTITPSFVQLLSEEEMKDRHKYDKPPVIKKEDQVTKKEVNQ